MLKGLQYAVMGLVTLVLIAGAVWVLFPQEQANAAAQYNVVVNAEVAISAVSTHDLENILLGKKKKWDDGTRIYIAILKEGDLNEVFLRKHAHKTADQFNTYWKKQVFTGKGIAPKSLESEEQLLEYLAQQKGAIGYCSTTPSTDGVKAVEIQ